MLSKLHNKNICKIPVSGEPIQKEVNSESKFVIVYVGVASSNSIYERINSWYKLTLNNKVGSYFNYYNEKEEKLDLILTHFQTDNIVSEDIIKLNIEIQYIFYTIPDEKDMKNLNHLYRPLYEIEGTLKNILREKMETRKYLLSLEYPKYGINPNLIINSIEDPAYSIKGII